MPLIKQEFYCSINYKWQLKKCRRFIEEQNLNSTNFTIFLENYFEWYFNEISPKGKLQAFSFINNLKNSKKFNKTLVPKKIDIKGSLRDFIFIVDDLYNECVNSELEVFLDTIYLTFNVGVAPSTWRRYFFEERKKIT